jgi:hypothetical protein
MARQLLADPDWPKKLAAGQDAAVRTCKFTNVCEAMDRKHLPVRCQLWMRGGVPGSGDHKKARACPMRQSGAEKPPSSPPWPQREDSLFQIRYEPEPCVIR